MKYRIWCPELEQTQDDAKEIDIPGPAPRRAVEQWAEEYDSTADPLKRLVEGDQYVVLVLGEGVTEPVQIMVEVELPPKEYHAYQHFNPFRTT